MIVWLINFIKKFILGNTDVNANGIADRDEILKMIEHKLERKREKENNKKLKKLLK
jgi:cell shape-determining protein MreC